MIDKKLKKKKETHRRIFSWSNRLEIGNEAVCDLKINLSENPQKLDMDLPVLTPLLDVLAEQKKAHFVKVCR